MSESQSLLLAHWDQTVRPTAVTPLEFYETLLDLFAQRGVPHKSVSYITRRESGLLSARRIHLRIRFRELIFDIAAMRVSDDALSVSWWLSKSPPGLFDLFCEIPGLRFLLRRLIRPTTFYRFDTAVAFQRLVQQCVVDAISQITSPKIQRRDSTPAPLSKEFYSS